MTGYDVIGDIHGHGEPLERLLHELGYSETDGAYRHRDRQVIFVGDLIDRGPAQLRVLEIARSMVDAGTAKIVMGNHEFNAIAWATPLPSGGAARPHSIRNRNQHEVFLRAVTERSPVHVEWIDWFRTIPMWLDLGDLRVVHACWSPQEMAMLGDGMLTEEIVTAPKGSPLYEALEVVLKGPEIYLGDLGYLDKEDNPRRHARFRWWDPDASTLRAASELPGRWKALDGSDHPGLPEDPLDRAAFPAAPDGVPVLYGHYWRSGGAPYVDGPASACLDWSIAKGGQLVAYRWSGEAELTNDNLVAVR